MSCLPNTRFTAEMGTLTTHSRSSPASVSSSALDSSSHKRNPGTSFATTTTVRPSSSSTSSYRLIFIASSPPFLKWPWMKSKWISPNLFIQAVVTILSRHSIRPCDTDCCVVLIAILHRISVSFHRWIFIQPALYSLLQLLPIILYPSAVLNTRALFLPTLFSVESKY